jgi:cation diffusion facilitator family transporter
LLKIAPYYSVAAAIIISVVKYYSLLTTDSASLFASLIDSLLDLSTSIINLIALRMALVPPDHNHRFGHNKIEDLAVFAQSVGFFVFGIFSFYNATNHFIKPGSLDNVNTAIYAMIFSSILTIMLVIYQSFVIKKTKSSLIEADRLHYIADLLTNIVVIFSLYFSSRFIALDAIFGILIACYIVYSSYGLFVRATKNLVDEELNDGERAKILGIIAKHKEVLGIHELKTRYAGSKPFIQFHLEMDGNSNLFEAHMLSDRIMEDILKAFPEAEVIIHQDPAGVEENVLYREKL